MKKIFIVLIICFSFSFVYSITSENLKDYQNPDIQNQTNYNSIFNQKIKSLDFSGGNNSGSVDTEDAKQKLQHNLQTYIINQDLSKLINNVTKLKTNTSYSKQILKGYEGIISITGIKKLYIEQAQYIEMLLSEYKLTKIDEENYLNTLFTIYNNFKMISKAKEVIKTLNYIDPNNYNEKFLIFKLKYPANKLQEKNALKGLENLFNKSCDKNIAKILGDYYKEKNSYKAIYYYTYSNQKIALIKEYEKINDEKNATLILKTLTLTQKNEIAPYLNQKNFNIIIKKYMLKAQNEKKDSNMAKIYYNRILKYKIKNSVSQNALFYIGEIFFEKGDYKNCIATFTNYLNLYQDRGSLQVYYDLGFSNYKLKNLAQALKYFNYIMQNYPDTKLYEKAKIYYFNINNSGSDSGFGAN